MASRWRRRECPHRAVGGVDTVSANEVPNFVEIVVGLLVKGVAGHQSGFGPRGLQPLKSRATTADHHVGMAAQHEWPDCAGCHAVVQSRRTHRQILCRVSRHLTPMPEAMLTMSHVVMHDDVLMMTIA
jgi:hypothetical protein